MEEPTKPEVENYSGFKKLFGETPTTKILDFFLRSGQSGRDYSLSEIAKEAGIGWSTINEIFPALVSARLLRETRQIGRARMYALNAESPLVRKIIELEKQLLSLPFIEPTGDGKETKRCHEISVVGIGKLGVDVANRLNSGPLAELGTGIVIIDTEKGRLDKSDVGMKILLDGVDFAHRPRLDQCKPYWELCRQATLNHQKELKDFFKDSSDLLFVVFGMDTAEGTEPEVARVVAELAKDSGSVVIAIALLANSGLSDRLNNLGEKADGIVLAEPEKLMGDKDFLEGHKSVFMSLILVEWIESLVKVLTVPSLANVNYSDIRAVLTEGKLAVVGSAEASGTDRAWTVARRAMENLSYECQFNGPKNKCGAIMHIVGGPDMTLEEVNGMAADVAGQLGRGAKTCYGVTIDPSIKDGKVRLMVLLGGVEVEE